MNLTAAETDTEKAT